MKHFLSAVLLILPVCGRGAEPVPDFSAGFERLVALGLPELDKDARWARVGRGDDMEYRLRQVTEVMKGNGWVQPGTDGGLRIRMGGFALDEGGGGKPVEKDVGEDVEKLIKALHKKAASTDRNDVFSLRHETEGFGRLLVFAAQLYQTGRTELANRLALATFAVYPDRELAVDAAVHEGASHFHETAVSEFFESGDWKAYHRELAALVERFPRGWEERGAVAMMLPQIARQAAGELPPVPSLPDMAIDPRALEAIASFHQPGNDQEQDMEGLPPGVRTRIVMPGGGSWRYDNGPGDLWLLPEAEAGGGNADSPQARLTALGMAALPALAAICDDPTFTLLPNHDSGSMYFSSRESDAERTLRAYRSMSRPATRGEIAKRMLAATLPDPNSDLGEADGETLRDLAIRFWKQHADDTPDELAALFLREGSDAQAKRAAGVLAASKDAAAHRIFEEHVLASDPALSSFEAVQTYVRARRSAAKSFIDEYAKLVRAQTSGSDDDDTDHEVRWLIRQAGGVDKILKQLDMLVEAQSPRSFAVQTAKGPPDDVDAALGTLDAMLEDASPKKSLYAYLEGASAAADPTVRVKFISRTLRIPWRGGEDGSAAVREPGASELRVWRKLIGDERKVDGSSARMFGSDETKVSTAAATALEYSVSPEQFSAVHEMSGVIGRDAAEVIAARAAARIDGKPVPPLPDPAKVSKERLAEIVAAAAAKPAADVHPYLASLDQDERAAWAAWLAEPGETEVPASVRELSAMVIRRVSRQTFGLSDSPGAGGIDVGFRVSRDDFGTWLESTAAAVAERSRTFVLLMPADFGPGLSILSPVMPLPDGEAEGDDDAADRTRGTFSNAVERLEEVQDAEGLIMANAAGENGNSQGRWLVRNGKPVADDADSFDAAAFLDALSQAGTQPGRFRMQILILSRADAEKLSETND